MTDEAQEMTDAQLGDDIIRRAEEAKKQLRREASNADAGRDPLKPKPSAGVSDVGVI